MDVTDKMLPKQSQTQQFSNQAHAIALVVSTVGAMAMFCTIAYSIGNGSGSEQLKAILGMPWGITSLIDLYVGFTIFSMWIWFREQSRAQAIAWTCAMMIGGNFTASVYVLKTLRECGGDVLKFFLGHGSNSHR
jgi:hypothetical protein